MDTKENARFYFLIESLPDYEGNYSYSTQIVHLNIPIEIVIMKMRAFLRSVEGDYYQNFRNDAIA